MVASSLQVSRDFTVGLLLVVTGMTVSEVYSERNISPLKSGAPTSMQLINTRFIAARSGARVSLSCHFGSIASWQKQTEKGKYQEIISNPRVQVTRNASTVMVQISKLQHADNGIYLCKANNSLRQLCGTELRVMGISTFEQVQSRHTLKDALIIIQTILLVLFLSIPVFLTQGKGDRKDGSGEEHTYEGLTVELADTYEDIGIYQDRAEKWDLGEHPCKK